MSKIKKFIFTSTAENKFPMVSTYDIFTCEVIEEEWKPEVDEKYYIVGGDLIIYGYTWDGGKADSDFLKIGNCFRTRSEAEAMSEKFRKLLKGESL